MIRRWVFNVAALLSLLMCIASIAIWKWSFADTASHVVKTQPWVELDLVNGHLVWMKITGLAVERRDHWIDDPQIAYLPRTLPDDWGTRFFDDGRFLQLTSDGRLITSERVLLPIVRSPAFNGARLQTLPGITHIQGTFSQHGQVEIRSVSFMLFALAFSLLPLCMVATRIVRRGKYEYRRRTGVNPCERCGYSLKGNTSGVCPECGTAVPQRPQTIA